MKILDGRPFERKRHDIVENEFIRWLRREVRDDELFICRFKSRGKFPMFNGNRPNPNGGQQRPATFMVSAWIKHGEHFQELAALGESPNPPAEVGRSVLRKILLKRSDSMQGAANRAANKRYLDEFESAHLKELQQDADEDRDARNFLYRRKAYGSQYENHPFYAGARNRR